MNDYSSYIRTLDTHNYDQWIRQNFNTTILPRLPPITGDEVNFFWKEEIIPFAESTNHYILKDVVGYMYRLDDIDGNTQYSCNVLGAQVWKSIRDNADGIINFMQQFIDMHDTNGFCMQGRTNRYIQVFLAFN